MSSRPGMRADPVAHDALDGVDASQLPFFVNHALHGLPTTKLVCGFLACDAAPFNPLLANLPPVIKAGGSPDTDTSWLGEFIRLAMAESSSKRAGGESVLAKLSELMFIEVVRRYRRLGDWLGGVYLHMRKVLGLWRRRLMLLAVGELTKDA
jgi:hypothetical protein